jgi:hypothetical protein
MVADWITGGFEIVRAVVVSGCSHFLTSGSAARMAISPDRIK